MSSFNIKALRGWRLSDTCIALPHCIPMCHLVHHMNVAREDAVPQHVRRWRAWLCCCPQPTALQGW